MSRIRTKIAIERWKDFMPHWKNDLVAAISVSLVALPLSLAIAVASGLPPIAGLIGVVLAAEDLVKHLKT